ncbi:Cthe_2314 family HEPN domain-containing protein [Formosa agariphila]|nr:Cthe_2314 family HEPN domain-containing protein [Formosa agariphila]
MFYISYVEIYYYFFFSSLETLAHILNYFFDMGKNESQVKFWGKLFSEIESNPIKQQLISFNESIKETIEKRNSFTHRFPQNENDFRTTLTTTEGRNLLQCNMRKRIKNEEFLQNITESSKLLESLINNLKLEFDDIV